MGFCLKAQGCEARATLGKRRADVANPNGVAPVFAAPGSRNPVGVVDFLLAFPRVARSEFPYREGMGCRQDGQAEDRPRPEVLPGASGFLACFSFSARLRIGSRLSRKTSLAK